MLEEKRNKLKEMFSLKMEGNNKKKIENLVVFVIILIITIVVINTIWNGETEIAENTQTNTDKVLAKLESNEEEESSNNLEQKLEVILQNIEGVGKVKVLLTYSESSTTVAMYNEDSTKSDTEETDSRSVATEKYHKLQVKKKLFMKKKMEKKFL